MKNYRSADTISNAISLLNQFRNPGTPRFSESDFDGCIGEIQIENRYKKLLYNLLNNLDERRKFI